MTRSLRLDVSGEIYHCLNRANARMQIFFTDDDYRVFEQTLVEAIEIFETSVLSYCVMPNHFHLVVQTKRNGELSMFMRWLTITHTQRWHQHHNTRGSGHLYQGRYKSFHVANQRYLCAVLQYVERNPLDARLTHRALEWQYSSVYKRYIEKVSWLTRWPIKEPEDYLKLLESGSENSPEGLTTPH